MVQNSNEAIKNIVCFEFSQFTTTTSVLGRNLPRPRYYVLLSPYSAAHPTARTVRLQGQIHWGLCSKPREQLGFTTHGVHQFTFYTTADIQTPGQPFFNTPLFREEDTTEDSMDNNMLIKEHSKREGNQEGKVVSMSTHPGLGRITAVQI